MNTAVDQEIGFWLKEEFPNMNQKDEIWAVNMKISVTSVTERM